MTIKFKDHTGYLPDQTNAIDSADDFLAETPFYESDFYHWGIGASGSRWECDDAPYKTASPYAASTNHQIWFKMGVRLRYGEFFHFYQRMFSGSAGRWRVRDVGIDEELRNHALLEHEFSDGYEWLRWTFLPRICQ